MTILTGNGKRNKNFYSYALDNLFYDNNYGFTEKKSIEERIDALLESHATLVEILAEKGLLNADEVKSVLNGAFGTTIELVKED